MRPDERKDLADGAVEQNAEQREAPQAQDVADDRLYGVPGDDHDILASEKAHGGVTDDEDYIDTVDQLKQMVTSGRIDMGAYDGEPMMDDGDTDISDTESPDGMEGGRGDDNIGGRDSDRASLEDIADTGDDPLALLSSDHGDDGETSDDDANPDDIDEDEFPGGLVLGEDAYDAARAHDARGEEDDRED